MRFVDAQGTRVVSRDDATDLGRVLRLLVDPAGGRVTAVHVTGRRRKARLVDWDAITGFGPDAVVVTAADALRGPRDGTELAAVSGDLDLRGRRALTDGGDALGTIREVEFDERSGALTAITTEQGTHPGEALRAVGSYCAILRASSPAGPETDPARADEHVGPETRNGPPPGGDGPNDGAPGS